VGVGVGVGVGVPAATGEPVPDSLPPPHAARAEAINETSSSFLIGRL
jgi:hypothetical protein